MHFENLDGIKKVSQLLAESDFERADCRWDGEGMIFVLETTRPIEEKLKGAGLFRKPRPHWVKCRLEIHQVRRLSIWEEYDVKPPIEALLQVEPSGSGFLLHLRSAHGLRVDLTVDRLDGLLEDVE